MDEIDGIPIDIIMVDELVISDRVADHIRARPERYPGARSLEPSWVREAATADSTERRRPGVALLVTGYSPSAGMYLTAVLLPVGHVSTGRFELVTAYPKGARG